MRTHETVTDFPTVNGVPVWPVFGGTTGGGQYGIVPQADALVTHTADGVDINSIWDTFRDAVSILNTERSQIADLISFRTYDAATAIAQNFTPPNFTQATEFGVPPSVGTPAEPLLLGFTLKDWNLASRLSWKALRFMDSRQVTGILNSLLEADIRNVTGQVLYRLFHNGAWSTDTGVKSFPLWSNDGIASPPSFMGNSFPADTSHYWATQNAVIDSQDLEFAYTALRSKGYGGIDGRSQILVLCNEIEAEKIMSWRSGVESRAGGPIAKYDAIASKKAPPFWTSEAIVGKVAPDDYHGHDILGTYGHGWIMASPVIPVGYVAVVSTGGPGSDLNPVGLRELRGYEGLLTMPGNWREFPLVESFYVRTMGTGIRHRGGAVCLQVSASSTYTPPTKAQFGLV